MHSGIYWVTVACLLVTANESPVGYIRLVAWASLVILLIGRAWAAMHTSHHEIRRRKLAEQEVWEFFNPR